MIALGSRSSLLQTLLVASLGFLLPGDVLGISPNPIGSYPAVVTYTNDGGQKFTRKTTPVIARMVQDENDPTEETLDGYTVVYNVTKKRYEYADVSPLTGDFVSSAVQVVRGLKPDKSRFKKHLRRTAAGRSTIAKTADVSASSRHLLSVGNELLAKISDYDIWNEQVENVHRHQQLLSWSSQPKQLKTLVVPLRFSDHTNSTLRWLPTKAQLTTLFNNNGPHQDLAPNGSIRDLFLTLSQGKLDLTADVMDWITLSKTESYYSGGKRGYKASTMHEALKEALDYLENTVKLDFSQYDADGDGLIDSICFLHSGFGAEWGGVAEGGSYFMNRIWSHKWNLSSLNGGAGWTSATHGVKVFNYPITSALFGAQPRGKPLKEKIARIGGIAHEMSHFLGLDASLFDNDQDSLVGSGLGSWDLAFNGWGFDNSQNCPPLLNPFSRIQLGWMSAKDITRADSGSNQLLKSSRQPDGSVYKVTEGFPTGEYLLLEYRARGGFESCLPVEGGLAVWHVDEQTSSFVSPGYPGSAGWPENGNHYRVALLQADGNYDLEQGRNRGDSTDLYVPKSTGIGPSGDPAVYPNTDAYQGGQVLSTGFSLSNIAMDSSSLTFDVFFEDPTTAPTSAAPDASSSPSTAPTKNPTLSPTSSPTSSPPTASPTNRPLTDSPTYAPTSSFSPTQSVPESCTGARERLFLFELQTDLMGSETTWELVDALRGPAVMAKGGPYQDGVSRTVRFGVCLEELSCWSLVIRDSAGNGIDGVANGNGYKVWWGGQLQYASKALADGSSPIFDETGVDFGEKCRLGPDRNVQYLAQHGDFVSEAIMFDVKGKMSSILMRFTRLHLKNTVGDQNVTYKVYTKNGSYQGYETDKAAWRQIKTETVAPKGLNVWTQAENWDEYLPLMEGTTQALYIELDQRVLFSMDCTTENINAPGQVYRAFDEMEVLSGVISAPGFGGIEYDKVACMEGKMTVSPIELEPAITQEPTSAPSDVPTASPSDAPTNLPSVSPTTTTMPSSSPTNTPTFYPTISSAPTLPIPESCPGGEKLFVFEVVTDMEGSDTTWELTDALRGPEVKAVGGPYRDKLSKKYSYGVCLTESSCWSISVKDAKGDGIQGVADGNGYKMTWDGVVLDKSMVLADGRSPAFDYTGADFGSGCRANQRRNTNEMSLTGTVASSAIMFDMKAKKDTFIIRFAALNLDIPAGGGTVQYKVYTKNGSYQGFETMKDAWNLVTTQTVTPVGKGSYTSVSNFDGPAFVSIAAGTSQAFYVELDKPVLMATRGMNANITDPGKIVHSYPEVDILSGVFAKRGFAGVTAGNVAIMDGRVTLSGLDVLDFASMVPSSAPTGVPTASPSAAPSGSPSASPTRSSSPTMSPSTPAPTITAPECEPHEKLFTLFLQTDDFGSENTWKVINARNNNLVLAEGGPYPDGEREMHRYDVCLHSNGCYKFVLSDTAGDGLNGRGTGFRAVYDGKLEGDTISDGKLQPSFSKEGVDFGDSCSIGSKRQSQLIGSNGQILSYGIMFDVIGKKDSMVMRFATINTKEANVNYNATVYTKNGSYKGYETDKSAWKVAGSEIIVGGGPTAWTSMNNWNTFVPVLEGTRQAFYLVLDKPELRTTSGSSEGIVKEGHTYKQFPELDILSGIVTGKNFGGKIPGSGVALMDGRIAYGDIVVEVTSPTAAPTASPSAAPSGTPSASPTISSAPTASPSTPAPTRTGKECAAHEKLFTLFLQTDDFGSENTWSVVNVRNGGLTLAEGGPYPDGEQKTYRRDVCLDTNGCYRFVLNDASGDGMKGLGHGFRAVYDGKLEGDTISAGNLSPDFFKEGVDFGDSCKLGPSRQNYAVANSATKSSYGTMFDIKGKQDAMLMRFAAIKTLVQNASYQAKVYTKNGSYKGYETDRTAWRLVADTRVTGGSAWTVMSNFDEFVPILAGTRQAFYIVLDKPELMTSVGPDHGISKSGVVLAQYPELDILSGIITERDFGGKVAGSGVALLDGRFVISDVEIEITSPTAAPSAAPTPVPTATPSFSPTISRSPTAYPSTAAPTSFSCPDNHSKLRIDLQTDVQGSQTSWQLVDISASKKILHEAGPYTDETKAYHYDYCVHFNSCYKFVVRDSASNGIQGTGNGNGFKVTYEDKVEVDTMTHQSAVPAFKEDGVDFGNCNPDGGFLNTIGLWNDGAAYGQMFDIKGKTDTVMRRFNAIQLASGSHNYKVYTKNGSYKGYENDQAAWTLVLQQTINGAGANSYTIGNNFSPWVAIMSGTTQAFYVVVDKPSLYYGNGATRGFAANSVYKSFPEYDIITGVAFNSPTPFSGTPIANVRAMFSGRITHGTARTG